MKSIKPTELIIRISISILVVATVSLILAGQAIVIAEQQNQALTSAPDIVSIKETDSSSIQLTKNAAPKTPPLDLLWTETPGSRPTWTPFYGDCPPRIAGDGLLFGFCRFIGIAPMPIGLRKYGANNSWVKEINGKKMNVVAGNGAIAVFPPDEFPQGTPNYYLVPNNLWWTLPSRHKNGLA